MITIVNEINPVAATVRRNHRRGIIQIPRTGTPEREIYSALVVGDRVEVKRVTNNPYLILVGRER